MIGKWKAECGWWSSDLPFHYFSNNRPLLSLYQFPFQAKAMQGIASQHKHFFVLNIFKSSLIRYPVSHPHPGSLTHRGWDKKPSESLHLSMRTDYFTKQSPVSWKSLFSKHSEDCLPWLTQDYLEISITPASFSEWLTSLQLALACQLFQQVAVTMLSVSSRKKSISDQGSRHLAAGNETGVSWRGINSPVIPLLAKSPVPAWASCICKIGALPHICKLLWCLQKCYV